tara:strand:- start:2923 stop:4338 length:1416 start_codon:yes stop_codon:yes gene_type:complete
VATLAKKDFDKPASGGPYAGTSRQEIFLKKIQDNKPFVIGATKNGTKVIGVSYDTGSGKFVYKSSPSSKQLVETTFTKVFKDKDFGGGGGSGGGAEDTKYTESMQCYYCSYVFNVKKSKLTAPPTDDELKKSEKFVYADATLDNCMTNGPIDWIETGVYIKTANKMFEAYKGKMKSPVYFHRGSGFMNDLYKAKAAAHKIDKDSDNPQAPGSFSNDKWNPGDIWATTFGSTTTPLADYTASWGELNSRVYDLASKGQLLGISLKKIGPQKSIASLQEFNSPSLQAKRKSYSYLSFAYGKTGDFFSSQDIYLSTSEGQVQFRTFGGPNQWQGEIKAGDAAGGKIGGGNVDFFCKQVFGRNSSIYGRYDSERDFLASIKRDEQTGEYQKRLYELYSKYNSKSMPTKPLMTEADFIAKLDSQEYNLKNSKAICMEFIDVLHSGFGPNSQNEFTTKMFRYAQSDVDQSSYFIKLY